MQKYYSNLLILEKEQKEGIFCKGRGWQIDFEPKPSSQVFVGPNGEPAKEIIVYAQSADRAQYVVNMILAAWCLNSGEPLTFDAMPVFQSRAQTIAEIEEQILAGGGRALGVLHLPVSCLIAARFQASLCSGRVPQRLSPSRAPSEAKSPVLV